MQFLIVIFWCFLRNVFVSLVRFSFSLLDAVDTRAFFRPFRSGLKRRCQGSPFHCRSIRVSAYISKCLLLLYVLYGLSLQYYFWQKCI